MPEAYINYYKKSLELLKNVASSPKPTLLLHACCGPCSTFPLTFLCPHFAVTIYYNNSNIFPEAEYARRLEELKRFLVLFKRDYGYDVNLIVPPYDPAGYDEFLRPYGDMKEGQLRCHLCYKKRMEEAYDFATKEGYDWFTTVMTISRQKDSEILNAIAKELEPAHLPTKYFYSDFKKNKGIDLAREMRIHYDLYNQLYCGCRYSLKTSKKE